MRITPKHLLHGDGKFVAASIYQGMKQQVHSASSPHGQLTQPVLIVLIGLEMEEAVLLEAMEPGMVSGSGGLLRRSLLRGDRTMGERRAVSR